MNTKSNVRIFSVMRSVVRAGEKQVFRFAHDDKKRTNRKKQCSIANLRMPLPA
jgi:hypothetical protein